MWVFVKVNVLFIVWVMMRCGCLGRSVNVWCVVWCGFM